MRPVLLAVLLVAILLAGGYWRYKSNSSSSSSLPPEKQAIEDRYAMERATGSLNPAPINLISPPASNEPTDIPLTNQPLCTAADLSAEFIFGQPVMAGGMTAFLVFKNISSKPCFVSGYPSIRLLGNKGQNLGVNNYHARACTTGDYSNKQYTECPPKSIVIKQGATEAQVDLFWTNINKGGAEDMDCPLIGATALEVVLPKNGGTIKNIEPRSQQPFISNMCGSLTIDLFRYQY